LKKSASGAEAGRRAGAGGAGRKKKPGLEKPGGC